MGLSDQMDLPVFRKMPHYDIETVGPLKIRWFEQKFSQSHYNIHSARNASNACTLIAIIMATKCETSNVIVKNPNEDFNIRLIHLFGCSMMEGNKLHEELKTRKLLNDVNLTIPEALNFTENQTNLIEWKCSIHMDGLISLYKNIGYNYQEWLNFCKDPEINLYVVLISDFRTVLFVFQGKSNTVSLFDSHQHSLKKGAFIAITTIEEVGHLCFWYKNILKKFYSSDPKLYELSFLYFTK